MIVDDHPATRDGLCALVERESDMRIVALAADGNEALARFREHQPDLTLMDLQMPGMDGLQAAGAILNESPQALIAVLTSYDGDARVARARSMGIRAYLLKTAHPRAVRDALRRVLEGEVVMDVQTATMGALQPPREQLTSREIDVIKLIALGNPNHDIGRSLHVSVHTVKARIKSLLAKLGAKDRAHAVTLARGRGFLDF
jgi:DNA-binding NarL/FixJ family response regulator